ncbi:hypothetical protein V1511DRAFT_44868 [Dipodascopsis uninucleata]
MDYLNSTQAESLQQFVMITSWPENDMEGAIQMLSICQWNVELAITRYYDEGPLRPNPNVLSRRNVSAPDDGRPITPEPVVAPRLDDPAPRTIAPRPSFITTALTSLILLPFAIVSKVAHGAFYIFAMLFPFLPRLTGIYPSNMGAARSERRSVNPRDTAARFIRDFEEEVGKSRSEVLPFFEGGYTQALDAAKKELRFLLIILQSDEHDDTSRFNRNILTNPDIVRYVREKDMIVWGGNVRESEAYQVANALSCTRYPFVAMIAYTPPTSSHPASMSIHGRLQGYSSPESVLTNLQAIVDRHESVLQRVRSERLEQQTAREIRAAQDMAYEASLTADREREHARVEAERVEREQREAEVRAAAAKVNYRKWRANELRVKMAEVDASASNGMKVARVSIRLPSGDRIVTRFAENQTVKDVYDFVECYEDIMAPSNTADSVEQPPDNYEHHYKFKLVSPMPRMTIETSSDKLIKEEKALWPNGNLIVEEEEEEEEEEEDTE